MMTVREFVELNEKELENPVEYYNRINSKVYIGDHHNNCLDLAKRDEFLDEYGDQEVRNVFLEKHVMESDVTGITVIVDFVPENMIGESDR